jgi:hypothetical protein
MRIQIELFRIMCDISFRFENGSIRYHQNMDVCFKHGGAIACTSDRMSSVLYLLMNAMNVRSSCGTLTPKT